MCLVSQLLNAQKGPPHAHVENRLYNYPNIRQELKFFESNRDYQKGSLTNSMMK